MSNNTSITLGEHWNGFIRKLLDSGRYGSTSEVVRESLRLLEEREVKLERLRAALVEGEESGSPELYNHTKFLKDMKDRHGAG